MSWAEEFHQAGPEAAQRCHRLCSFAGLSSVRGVCWLSMPLNSVKSLRWHGRTFHQRHFPERAGARMLSRSD